jgi:hypothetical protein
MGPPNIAVRTFNLAPKEEEKDKESRRSSSSRGPESKSQSILFEENSDIEAELEKLDKKEKKKL